MFSIDAVKRNRWQNFQTRHLLLTTEGLSNIKKGKTQFQRTIKIAKIRALTKCIEKDAFDFIIHVKDEYDYYYVLKND